MSNTEQLGDLVRVERQRLHQTARAEWLIASAIVVATLILVLFVLGLPHVM